jgi:acyl-CoA synthetase (AMP-forming)/AMP-acid ligase II
MLRDLVDQATPPAELKAIITPTGAVTWGQLRELAGTIADVHRAVAKRRIGLSFASEAYGYAALAALDRLECDAFLFDARAPIDEAFRLAAKLKLGALIVPTAAGSAHPIEVHELSDEAPWSGNRSVTILTSGSTGEPKAVRHSWESLCRPVRKTSGMLFPRWLLAYQPHLYAGLQVMIQCFAEGGTLAIANQGLEPSAIARFICDAKVQYASATPSYWRRLLMFGDRISLGQAPLIQITLGGETVDQSVLDSLSGLFPNARIVHIYATTELGRCFTVTDGLAGFPATYLDSALPDGTELQVRDGELFVRRSANAMAMYDPLYPAHGFRSEWFSTGDLVDVRGTRVCFMGRRTEMINVAGSKVYPLEVENVIRTVPGVADVRVFGRVSSIAGEMVACEVVVAKGQNESSLKEQLIRVCRANLSNYKQPRQIRFVQSIDMSAAGKTLRSKTV